MYSRDLLSQTGGTEWKIWMEGAVVLTNTIADFATIVCSIAIATISPGDNMNCTIIVMKTFLGSDRLT